MNCTGIVVEYNPFHNGHLYHLNKTKELTNSQGIIAVMSGNWVQRGEPAIMDKWARAEMALRQGVDLVIELPFIWSTQSASEFAEGSVSLLEATGVVKYQTFGSESSDINFLNRAARTLYNEPENLKTKLKKYLGDGNSYPSALTKALNESIETKNFEEITPNDILGIEYLKAHEKFKTNINVKALQRIGSSYHDNSLSSKLASATAIRTAIKNNQEIKNYVPDTTYKILNEFKNNLVFFNDLEGYILYRLRTASQIELTKITGWEKGIENMLKNAAIKSTTLQELINYATTRRYTRGRINRYLIHLLMGIKREKINYFNKKGPPYIRILGMNSKGQGIIKKMKKTARLPVLTRPAKELRRHSPFAEFCFDQEVKATSLYNLIINKPGDDDYKKNVVII